MAEPAQTSIAEQHLGNHVSVSTDFNKDWFPLKEIAANESLLGSKSLNKVIPVTTQRNIGTARYGDFCPGRVAVIEGSAFVNSRNRVQSEIRRRDSSDRRSESVHYVSSYD
jgi:hypothetical protein